MSSRPAAQWTRRLRQQRCSFGSYHNRQVPIMGIDATISINPNLATCAKRVACVIGAALSRGAGSKTFFLPKRASDKGGWSGSMSLILLPDNCCMPNMGGTKRKARDAGGQAGNGRASPSKLHKGASFFSDSSGGSSRSRASAPSVASSSRCSFPADVCEDGEDDVRNGARVRIAVAGM